MVVVPGDHRLERARRALVDDLEVRFLGNRDPHLHFALLTDFADADAADRCPATTRLVAERARAASTQLNARYGAGRFFFFHRERRWNAGEQRWMGWERKRGKLVEFNRLLRGATDTSLPSCHGDRRVLPAVRYVITLDSDTQLPMEAARRLVGTLAHPLNRPRFDPRAAARDRGLRRPAAARRRRSRQRQPDAVRAGLLRPRRHRSVHDRRVGHLSGPVSRGQLRRQGDLRRRRVRGGAGRTGCPRTRCSATTCSKDRTRAPGWCTDIHLVDDYPANYLAFASRQHRWVRGDWQIVRWLWRTVPDAHRPRGAEHAAGRGALEDLRQPAPQPAGAGAAWSCWSPGWTMLPGSALLWTVLGVLVLAFPAYVQVGAIAVQPRARGAAAAARRRRARQPRHQRTQALLSTRFLPHQAWLMLDAIVRTLWRLLVSRRNLLEWVSADRLAGGTPRPAEVARADVGRARHRHRRSRRSSRRSRRVTPAAGAADDRCCGCVSPRIAYATGRPLRLTRGRPIDAPIAPRCGRSRDGRGGSSKICSARPITG